MFYAWIDLAFVDSFGSKQDRYTGTHDHIKIRGGGETTKTKHTQRNKKKIKHA